MRKRRKYEKEIDTYLQNGVFAFIRFLVLFSRSVYIIIADLPLFTCKIYYFFPTANYTHPPLLNIPAVHFFASNANSVRVSRAQLSVTHRAEWLSYVFWTSDSCCRLFFVAVLRGVIRSCRQMGMMASYRYYLIGALYIQIRSRIFLSFVVCFCFCLMGGGVVFVTSLSVRIFSLRFSKGFGRFGI